MNSRHRTPLAVALGVALAVVLSPLEPLGLDGLFRARNLVHGIRPVDARIRLIVVDEQAFGQLQKPYVLWQAEFAQVLTALAKAETAVVGIDMALNSKEDEEALVQSMQLLPVVLSEQTQLPHGGLPMLGGDPTVRQSATAFTRVAKAVADDALRADAGVVRAMPPPTSFVARVAEVLTGRESSVEGLINYPGAGGSLPEDNFSEVLTRLKGGNPLFEFKGTACLIVADGWTYRNLVETPFGLMSTGDVQGAALNTILMGNPVRRLPLPLTVVLTTLTALAGLRLRKRWLVGLAVAYAAVALELFTFTNWCLPVLAPLVGLGAGHLARLLVRRRRQRGTRHRATMLHSHLGGFSAGSPEETIALLEDYVEDMDLIAFSHGGVITRLAGDELLGLFPSADAALEAGLEMHKHVEGMPEFAGLRMGLHTGEVITGDVSGRRTVLGEEVTQALEVGSESRASGIRILASAATRREVTLPTAKWQSCGSRFALLMEMPPVDQPDFAGPGVTETDAEPAKEIATGRAVAAQAKTAEGSESVEAEPIENGQATDPTPEPAVLDSESPQRTAFGSVVTHVVGADLLANGPSPEAEQGTNNSTGEAEHAAHEPPADFPAGSPLPELPEPEHEANVPTEGSPDVEHEANVPTGGSPDGEHEANIPTGGSPAGEHEANVPTGGSPDAEHEANVPTGGSPAGEHEANVPTGGSPDGEHEANIPTGGSPAGEHEANVPTGGSPAGEHEANIPTGGSPDGEHEANIPTGGSPDGEHEANVPTGGSPDGEPEANIPTGGSPDGEHEANVPTGGSPDAEHEANVPTGGSRDGEHEANVPTEGSPDAEHEANIPTGGSPDAEQEANIPTGGSRDGEHEANKVALDVLPTDTDLEEAPTEGSLEVSSFQAAWAAALLADDEPDSPGSDRQSAQPSTKATAQSGSKPGPEAAAAGSSESEAKPAAEPTTDSRAKACAEAELRAEPKLRAEPLTGGSAEPERGAVPEPGAEEPGAEPEPSAEPLPSAGGGAEPPLGAAANPLRWPAAPSPRAFVEGRPHRVDSEEGYCYTLAATARLTQKVQEPAAAWLERGERLFSSPPGPWSQLELEIVIQVIVEPR